MKKQASSIDAMVVNALLTIQSPNGIMISNKVTEKPARKWERPVANSG